MPAGYNPARGTPGLSTATATITACLPPSQRLPEPLTCVELRLAVKLDVLALVACLGRATIQREGHLGAKLAHHLALWADQGLGAAGGAAVGDGRLQGAVVRGQGSGALVKHVLAGQRSR